MKAIKWFFKIMCDASGNPSSKRFATLLLIVSFIVEWQRFIWVSGSFTAFAPNWTMVSLLAAALGITMWGKQYEDKPIDNKPTE